MDVRAYSLLILATVVTPAYGQDTTKTAPRRFRRGVPPIPGCCLTSAWSAT